jgi:RHS repeat-associated protein
MGSNTFQYDANGSMTSRVVNGVTYTLTYDIENRLTAISGGGLSAAYTYNADGARIKAVVTTGGVTRTTGYVGDYFEISVGQPRPGTPLNCALPKRCAFVPLASSGVVLFPGQAWYSYYYAGASRIALRIKSNQLNLNDGVFYFLSDHLGGTTLTLDANGVKTAELRYTAWGETRYTSGSTPTQRRYTGQLEAEAGLYFYNARWYDPSLGRFAQADTLIPDPAKSQSWDRYAYTSGNPVNRVDPDGHEDTDDCRNCGGGGAGGSIGSVENRLLPSQQRTVAQDLEKWKDVKWGEWHNGSNSRPASSYANKVLLQKQLASEAQMSEAGIRLAGNGAKTPLRVAPSLANKYGGNSSDWAKMGSSSFTAMDGTQFETHWYQNMVSGVAVEFKTKITAIITKILIK